jgi:hypothetical protein
MQKIQTGRDVAYWTRSAGDALAQFGVSQEREFFTQFADDLREKDGTKQLRDTRTKSVRVILVDQFKSPIVFLLTAALLSL